MSAPIVTQGFAAPSTGTASPPVGPSGVVVYFPLFNKLTGNYDAGIDLTAPGVIQVSLDGAAYANADGSVDSVGGGDYAYTFDSGEVTGVVVALVKVVKAGYSEVHLQHRFGDPAQVADVLAETTAVTAALVAAVSTIQSAIATLGASLPDDIDDVLTDSHGAGPWTAPEIIDANVVQWLGEAVPAPSEAGVPVVEVSETSTAVVGAAAAGSLLASALRTGSTVLGHLRRMDALFWGEVTGLLGTNVAAKGADGTTEFTVVQDLAAGVRSPAVTTNSEVP